MPPPGLIFGSRIFVIAACESVKMVTVVGFAFLVFLIVISRASEIAHSSVSNESFFSPKYCHFSCHLFEFVSNQTTADPDLLESNLDPSVQKIIPFRFFLAS